MQSIMSLISQGRWYNPSQVLGYTEDELVKIEKLYDIKISGNLRSFMLEMGRCSGGLIGDGSIILYNGYFSVRAQVMMQKELREDIVNFVKFDDALFELYYKKPFFISIESETQSYYLNTTGKDPERIFHYDENTDTVEETNMNFIEYLQHLVTVYGEYGPKVICRGELLLL